MLTTTATTTSLGTTGEAPTITAEVMLRLFPDVDASADALSGHDEEQIRLMDEMCIVLDENDAPIGKESKKMCHLMSNINKGLLHRAFSVFLFNDKNELLLQKRAASKITFPDAWTNSCCSHPLAVASETGAALPEAVEGAKRAAQRKLEHELGISQEQVPLDRFRFLTRIHYKAASDTTWGEHEIDYVFFIKANVDLAINENEVQAIRYVSQDEARKMLADPKLIFTPWFKLFGKSMLFEWWSHLDSGLDKYTNEQAIRRM